MGKTNSKAAKVEGNSNANEINIVQEVIQQHSDMVQILLVIIVIILGLFALCKVYGYHKRNIQKKTLRKSTDVLNL